MPIEPEKLVSNLGNSMADLYKVGGLMLTFVFVGALLMLGGHFVPGTNSRLVVILGAVVTIASLLLYALPQMQTAGAKRKTQDFCDHISGNWWERVTPIQGAALSWITIQAHPSTGTVVLNGCAFDSQGAEYARWESVASCVDADEAKVFYHWRGYQVTAPQNRYEGFGEITFRVAGEKVDTGNGVFFDARVGANSFTTKSFDLRRSTEPREEKTVEGGADRDVIAALIRKKLDEF